MTKHDILIWRIIYLVSKISLVVGIVLGAILLVVSVGGFFSDRTPADWQRTQGIVTEFTSKYTVRRGGGMRYAPVVEYKVNGVTYSVIGSYTATTKGQPQVGETRTVFYDPSDPSKSEVEYGKWPMWVLAGIGAIVLTVSVLVYRKINGINRNIKAKA